MVSPLSISVRLEQVNDAERAATWLTAAEIASRSRGRAELADGDRVRVDVERVRRLALIDQLRVTDVQHGARRQVVAVAQFAWLHTSLRAAGQVADRRAIRSAALAAGCLAVEAVDLAATQRNRCRNTAEVTVQATRAARADVATRSSHGCRLHRVTRLLIHQADLQTEALHDRAQIVRTGDAPVGVAQIRAARGVQVADLVVDFDGGAGLERAIAVDDVGADDVGVVDV